jgi:hypothetical protein
MDEIVRNLAPPVAGLLFTLYAWLEVRRMHRRLHRPPRLRPRARHPSGRRKHD